MLLSSCNRTAPPPGITGPPNPDQTLAEKSLFIRDTLTIRAILDSNGLTNFSYNDVAGTNRVIGRIDTLRLMGLNIKKILPIIDILTELTYLVITDNRNLHSLPKEVGNLAKLTTLKLTGNHLDSLPADLSKCSNLEAFYINNNFLNRIPDQLGNCIHIKQIEASDNLLDSIPISIKNLPNLEKITIDQNCLCMISSEVSLWLDKKSTDLTQWRQKQACVSLNNDLAIVKSILVDYNLDTTDFGAYIGVSAGRISKIDLSSKNISKWNALFFSLPFLATLNLSDNNLTAIPDTLSKLKKLTSINFSKNLLSTVPFLDSLSSLLAFNISENNISKFSCGYLPQLNDVNLSSNELTSVKDIPFAKLSKLQKLDVSHNNIDSIPESILSYQNLQVSVSGNKLCNLPSKYHVWLDMHATELQWDTLQNCIAGSSITGN